MENADKVTALKLRLPDCNNEPLLFSLIEEAEQAIKAMTGREEVPPALAFTQIKLAAIAYNRMGVEGEASHAEGGLSVSVDAMPDNIRREIAPWRLARTR